MENVKRKVFYSFHYAEDVLRVAQIKMIADNMDKATPAEWEYIKKDGDRQIKHWIDAHMERCSCVVVLIGEHTAGRKWIDYEINSALDNHKGLFGIYIHNLKDPNYGTSQKGNNPFSVAVGVSIYNAISTYNPPTDEPVKYIVDNIDTWIEKAISHKIRIC